MGRRRSSSYQESRKKVRSQKAMTAKERFIKSVLTKVMAKKNKKMASQKRASIIMNDDNSNAAFMELFDDGKKAIEEEERKKRSQVQRIVENMRLVLRTANDSKTRGGSVRVSWGSGITMPRRTANSSNVELSGVENTCVNPISHGESERGSDGGGGGGGGAVRTRAPVVGGCVGGSADLRIVGQALLHHLWQRDAQKAVEKGLTTYVRKGSAPS